MPRITRPFDRTRMILFLAASPATRQQRGTAGARRHDSDKAQAAARRLRTSELVPSGPCCDVLYHSVGRASRFTAAPAAPCTLAETTHCQTCAHHIACLSESLSQFSALFPTCLGNTPCPAQCFLLLWSRQASEPNMTFSGHVTHSCD